MAKEGIRGIDFMKKIVFVWMIMLCVLTMGCANTAEEESANDIAEVTNVADIGASWYEESQFYEDFSELVIGEKFPLKDGRFVQVTEEKIITDRAELNYTERFGELDSKVYLFYPSDEALYVLFETWASGYMHSLLLYEISEDEIVLCQKMEGSYIMSVQDSSQIKIWAEFNGPGRTRKCYRGEGIYCIDSETKTLTLAEDEWLYLDDDSYRTVKGEELPVTINGKEAFLPIGTKIRFVQTDLKGIYLILLEETGEEAVLTYETDEKGRYYIGGKSAGLYFKYGIYINEYTKDVIEIDNAIAELGDNTEVVYREYTIQGEKYDYKIEALYDVELDDESGWDISVYDGDTLIQKIHQDFAYSMWVHAEEHIYEADANFDGRMDLIVRNGLEDVGGNFHSNCYIGNEDGTFTESESFLDIKSPWIDEENQVIHDYDPQETYWVEKIYRYDENEFLFIETNRYEKDRETQEWVLKEAYTREDCVTYEHLLSAEGLSEADKTELQRFEAVFDDDTEIHLMYGETEEGFLPLQKVPDLYGVDTPGFLFLQDYTLTDVTADGKKDLIMRFSDIGGSVFVVCEENGEYYMSYHSVRQMQIVYENGWHLGSGGAGTYVYSQLRFENGKFWEETIALHDARTVYVGNDEYEVLFDCHVNEQPVTLEEFKAWEAENVGNEVSWYAVDMGE